MKKIVKYLLITAFIVVSIILLIWAITYLQHIKYKNINFKGNALYHCLDFVGNDIYKEGIIMPITFPVTKNYYDISGNRVAWISEPDAGDCVFGTFEKDGSEKIYECSQAYKCDEKPVYFPISAKLINWLAKLRN